MVSTYQLRNFPFHVAVMHDKKNLLNKWRQETTRDVALISATFITALITLMLALRQRKLRRKAEHRLMEHHQSLEETIRLRTNELQAANTGLKGKNRDLEAAMKEIKTLSGLLPICMHCKKIRDDQGYWKQMETYIHEHSDAQFSHSICRECAEKFYPDLDIYEDEED
jgi:C4-dicarboxylate-specific signal transduction histidine kinase